MRCPVCDEGGFRGKIELWLHQAEHAREEEIDIARVSKVEAEHLEAALDKLAEKD